MGLIIARDKERPRGRRREKLRLVKIHHGPQRRNAFSSDIVIHTHTHKKKTCWREREKRSGAE